MPALGTPVTGGNVSFYNQTGDHANLANTNSQRARSDRRCDASDPWGISLRPSKSSLLGETRDELAGSAWAGVIHDHLGGRPPAVDLAQEKGAG